MHKSYPDDELVMISALQHYLFCGRQCALIHVEHLWNENKLTAEGRVLHDRVDRRESETRNTVHLATSLRLVSKQLGIVGVADMVEFHQVETASDDKGIKVAVRLPRLHKFWIPFPVEYKHGKPKSHRADEVQLCAQAICLEEMLDCTVSSGALFYGKTRKRKDIPFDPYLRNLTLHVAQEVHELIETGKTPPAIYSKACESCSLFDLCAPPKNRVRSVKAWINAQIDDCCKGEE